jgi:hypothetical protein
MASARLISSKSRVEAHPALLEKSWKKICKNIAGIDAVNAAISSSGADAPAAAARPVVRRSC